MDTKTLKSRAIAAKGRAAATESLILDILADGPRTAPALASMLLRSRSSAVMRLAGLVKRGEIQAVRCGREVAYSVTPQIAGDGDA